MPGMLTILWTCQFGLVLEDNVGQRWTVSIQKRIILLCVKGTVCKDSRIIWVLYTPK